MHSCTFLSVSAEPIVDVTSFASRLKSMNLEVQCSMSRAEIVEKVFEPKVGVEIVKFSGCIDEQILHVNLSKHFLWEGFSVRTYPRVHLILSGTGPP